jgi:hypothetical protein
MNGIDIDAVHRRATDARQLTAAQLERYRSLHRVTLPHCAGPCDQGRKLCPCPEACESAAPDDGALDAASGIIVWVAGTLGAWGVIVAVLLAMKA